MTLHRKAVLIAAALAASAALALTGCTPAETTPRAPWTAPSC